MLVLEAPARAREGDPFERLFSGTRTEHLRLWHGEWRCWVEDRPVEEPFVLDGDELVAGETRFRIDPVTERLEAWLRPWVPLKRLVAQDGWSEAVGMDKVTLWSPGGNKWVFDRLGLRVTRPQQSPRVWRCKWSERPSVRFGGGGWIHTEAGGALRLKLAPRDQEQAASLIRRYQPDLGDPDDVPEALGALLGGGSSGQGP